MTAAELQPSGTPQRLAVTGMTCAGCVNAVTRVLSRVPGAANVRVTLGNRPGRNSRQRQLRTPCSPPCARPATARSCVAS